MKLRHSVWVGLAMLATAVVPLAASAQDGFNLSWDDCGLHGADLKTFACNANTGGDRLYVSASSSTPLPQANGVEVALFVVVDGATVSPWWHMETGGCRAGAITGFEDFTSGPFSCLDVWSGQAAGGINWQSGFNAANEARLRAVAAIPGSTSAPANTEMYVFGFNLSHVKSTGAGFCAGCSDAACIVLNSVRITQPVGVGDVFLTSALDRNVVGWKCPGVVYTDVPFPCANQCPTPARNRSWGTVKSLYR